MGERGGRGREGGGRGRGGGNHPPPPVFQAEERGGGGGYFSLSQVTRGMEEEGPHGRRDVDRAPHSKLGERWAPREEKQKTKTFFFLLIMIHLQMTISPSFLIRFRCFWAHWKALDE